MRKFGYVDPMPNAFVSVEEFEEGVKSMQRFGHIPVTGVIDKKTKTLLKVPRCGVKDVDHSDIRKKSRRETKPSYKQNGIFWHKRSLSYYVLNSTRRMERSTTENLLHKALELWQKASGLIFIKVQEHSEADIMIMFYSGSHSPSDFSEKDFDGPGGILAHVTTARRLNITPSVFVHFDDDEMWVNEFDKEKDCKGVGFFTVAVHELGHALGLNHNFVYGSIMNPYFRSSDPNIKLGYVDVLGMYDLYVGKNKISQIEVSKPNPLDFPPSLPDCSGNFDASLSYYDELILFKGKVLWRIWRGKLIGGRSFWTKEMFHFPIEIEKIDAAYQRKTDGKIIFFTGNQYWIFDYTYPSINQSFPISTLGFPKYIDSIDAAMVWGEKMGTYFFKKNIYWRYNEDTKKMDSGYPRSLRRWKYTLNKLDTAVSFRNGTTYFFKEANYWEISKFGYVTHREHPHSISGLLKCEKYS